MIPLSKSPSRIPGWLGCFRTVPDVGPARMAARIASPADCVTATDGIVGGAVVCEPVRIVVEFVPLPDARTSAIAPAALAARPLSMFWQPVLLPVATAMRPA